MSARNGDKSRFHRLRKVKIRRRLRTELLASLVTTKAEEPAPEKHLSQQPAPQARIAEQPAAAAPARQARMAEQHAPAAPAPQVPEQPAAAAPAAEAPHVSEGAGEDAPHEGPLAAAAKTIGGVLGAVAAVTGSGHKADSEPTESNK